MRPLTKCQPHLWRELDGTPSIIVIDTENGSYYRASEADARIAELEKRVAMLADQVVIRGRRMFELEAERDSLKVDRSLALEAVATAEAERDAVRADAERLLEAARRYYEGWCQDEASDEPEDGSDRCRWTGCTVEQRDAARALRAAIDAARSKP